MRPLLAFVGLCIVCACGGNVKVDGEPSGGAGGTGAQGGAPSSSSSTTPSTTNTGPMPSTTGPQPACECFDACQKFIGCFESVDCGQFCNQLPSQTWQCICTAPGCQLETCFNGTGGSGGSPQVCETCVQDQFGSACEMQLAACENSPQCIDLLTCHAEDCGFQPDCVGKCDQMFPGGVQAGYDLLACAVCGVCFESCVNSPLINYCPFK